MARLRIDGKEVEAGADATVLDAAQQAGIEVPTLCYLKKIGALTSCMICVVRDCKTGQMLPACSAKVADGMEIDTRSDAVRAARRAVLEMLLSEHVGDCEAPCSRICPAGLDIPRMLRAIVSGEIEEAARIAKRDLIFPATLGYLCTAPCEKGCRRGLYDAALSIRSAHGSVIARAAKAIPSTGKRVAIIGAGLAGLAAAWTCAQDGHACCVYEKASRACDSLDVMESEIKSIRAEFKFQSEVGKGVTLESILNNYDAVIVACAMPFVDEEKIFGAREDAMPVRSVAHGKEAGRKVNEFLSGPATKPARFNSQIRKLRAEEMAAYAVERKARLSITSTSTKEIAGEAARCLHCDCLKPASCKLRRYAEEYGLSSRIERFMERPAVAAIERFDDVLFEPGKCIKCGICVELARAAGLDFGVTFTGRGLATRVRAPFGEPLSRGLGEVALECARACPTGALALRNEEEST